MLDFLGPPLLIHCFISLFYQNTKIHQTNKTNQSFVSIKPFFAQLGQFGNSCNVSEQNKQTSTDEVLRKIATEMMSFFMFRQLIELVRMVNTITPNLPPFLPDDLDQHIGNKESTRNTQVNLPTSIWIAQNLNSPKYHSILNIFSIICLQISDREAIALGMRKMLDIATEPWGIKVDLANGIKSPESSPKLSLFHPHASSALNQTFIDNNIFELQSKCQRHIKANLNI